MAPEILELLYDSRDSPPEEIPHGEIQSDTFAVSCVFYYFLTRGKHLLGDSREIPVNVLHNNPKELNNHQQSKYFICILIMVFTRATHHFSDQRFARPIPTDQENDKKPEKGKNFIARGHQKIECKIIRVR
jgi:hypothetical protein